MLKAEGAQWSPGRPAEQLTRPEINWRRSINSLGSLMLFIQSIMILRVRSIDSNRPPPPKSAGPRAVIHGEKGKVAGPVGRLGWSRDCTRLCEHAVFGVGACYNINLLCCRNIF